MKRLLFLLLPLFLLTACAGTPTGAVSTEAASSASGSASVQADSAADGSDGTAAESESGTSSCAASDAVSEAASGQETASFKTSSASSGAPSKTSSVSSGTSSASSQTPVAKFTLPFKRGINLSGLEGENYSPWFWSGTAYLGKDETYTNIKNKGFDHVRLPVDLRRYYNADKKALKSNISDLDGILDRIEKAGLYCCLDFHGWATLNTADAAQKETFLTIWRLIAERYKDRSDKLCFELINEPHTTEGGNLDAVRLNALQAEVISLIRKTNPTRIILAAAAEWNGPWKLKNLNLPTDDGHLAVACHTYSPMDFTHQGATWAGRSADEVVHFSTSDKTATGTKDLDGAFNDIKKYQERTGIPVILNEFGVYTQNKADRGETTAWLTYVTNKCKDYDVPWTYWEYNKGFGAYQGGSWVDYIVKGLGLN